MRLTNTFGLVKCIPASDWRGLQQWSYTFIRNEICSPSISHLFKAGVAVKYLRIESISNAIITHHPHMSLNFGSFCPQPDINHCPTSVDSIIIATIQSTFSPKKTGEHCGFLCILSSTFAAKPIPNPRNSSSLPFCHAACVIGTHFDDNGCGWWDPHDLQI